MSVDQIGVVDLVGVDRETGEVILTISDHLDWHESLQHQSKLQEKINTYLAFVESGEIFRKYPDARDRQVIISVVGKHEPDANGREFLSRVKSTLKHAGFGFRFTILR
jgi:hypothetical protein